MKTLPTIISLALFCASTALAADIRALVQKSKPAVVQIGVFDQAGQLLATGTGFFITADGYLLTNYHVLSHASSILARDYRGTVYHLKKIAAIQWLGVLIPALPPNVKIWETEFAENDGST